MAQDYGVRLIVVKFVLLRQEKVKRTEVERAMNFTRN